MRKKKWRVTFDEDFRDHTLGRAGQVLAYYVIPVPSNSPRTSLQKLTQTSFLFAFNEILESLLSFNHYLGSFHDENYFGNADSL